MKNKYLLIIPLIFCICFFLQCSKAFIDVDTTIIAHASVENDGVATSFNIRFKSKCVVASLPSGGVATYYGVFKIL